MNVSQWFGGERVRRKGIGFRFSIPRLNSQGADLSAANHLHKSTKSMHSIHIFSSDRSSCSDDGLLYIYLYIRPLFQIFTQSIDAIDVTSVTLSRLNSINAIDVIRYLGHILGISRAYLGHI